MVKAIGRQAASWALLAALAPVGAALALDPARHVSEYTIRAWSVDDGLPHNLVHRIVQMPDGYLWVGTWEGLARFNGRSFAIAEPPPFPQLRREGIRGLAVDGDGALLVGASSGGLLRLHGDRWQRHGSAALAALRVTAVRAARDGALWVASQDAGLVRIATDGSETRFGVGQGLSSPWVHALAEAADGSILAATDVGLDRVADSAASDYGSSRGLPSGIVRTLHLGHDGSLWTGGANGVHRLRGERFEALDLGTTVNVQALLEDKHHALWIGTLGHGLLRWRAGTVETVEPKLGLRGTGVRSLFEDREGLLWVGTTSGLHRIADGPVSGLDEARGLSDAYARTVVQDSSGAVWIGTGNGLNRWRDGRVERFGVDVGLPKSTILSLAADSAGVLWVGTYDRGLFTFDGRARPITHDAIGSEEIRALHAAADGSLWIGTSTGLVRRRADGYRRFTDTDGLPGNFVRSVYAAPDGSVWVGTSTGLARGGADGGFVALSTGQGMPERIDIFDINGDADGTLWIGSNAGLLRYRNERVRAYGSAEGLPNQTIYRVLDDGHGQLWLSSNRGVFRVARRQFEELDSRARARLAPDELTRDDGLPASQCNGGSAPAGWRDRDGRLWFPTAEGAAVIDPAAMDRYPRGSVPVALERLVIDGEPRAMNAELSLPPETRRIAIDYAGLSYRAQHGVRYRYRLDGFDPDWIDAGTDQHAEYTNVPPGDYRFRVQAMLLPANWSQADLRLEAQAAFGIAPPFWRTPWFVAGALLATILLLGGTHRARVARFRRRARELRQLVEEQTHDLRDKNLALETADRERSELLQRLAYQASHDDLTGLYNRRAGNERLAAALTIALRDNRRLSVGLLDIDHFKRINDERSHQVGDMALCFVAERLQQALRDSDLTARYGGEEFLLIFPDTDLVDAIARCEAIRTDIAARELACAGQSPLRCTVSIGLATLSGSADSAQQLLAQADARLYLAKQQGRNCVVAAD